MRARRDQKDAGRRFVGDVMGGKGRGGEGRGGKGGNEPDGNDNEYQREGEASLSRGGGVQVGRRHFCTLEREQWGR